MVFVGSVVDTSKINVNVMFGVPVIPLFSRIVDMFPSIFGL